ncbi:LysR family transcriptional regulator [Cloacibacillus evryensis]|uniref:LysR family transcriptional regulator n=1 Tax=Cloacibacillus evryensis TaxID=508460 RepID=UPI00241FED72|nr:LysR family transcriptional regulator [Cloacibacillus evryensis]
MELKNINTFLRVAELNSFTKAANELGYSQSTVTIQIKQLESELGFMLFDRIGRRVSLTPKGEAFIGYANQFLYLEAQTMSLRDTAGSVTGTLRLGVLESLFVWRIADLLPQYYHMYPDVKIEIKSATGAALYRMLRQNELDIIYLLDNAIYHKDCVRACTSPVSLKFVTSPANPLCAKKDIPLAEVAKEPLILTERDAIYRRELDNEAAKNDIELLPILEVDNLEVVLRLLKKEMGVSFMPDYVLHESVADGELSVLDVRYNIINLWSQLVYHKNKFVTPQMQAFISLVQRSSAPKR